jgi:cellulose synthase/poly-beta-1,6-N-acetylglucosamine synthase-like glycosyltransferase
VTEVMVVFGILYAVALLLLAIGLARLPRTAAVPGRDLPRVSVVVACRNEEIDLPTCIRSIVALDYPLDRIEVFLVDDESTDATPRIIAQAAADYPHVHALTTRGFAGTLRAKARGVAVAARRATGEWLFITDADGEVNPGWVRHMLSGAGPRDGVLGGLVTVKGRTSLAVAEKVAWGYALPFAWGLAGWGAAMVCIGPNMAIRRRAYVEGGGLEGADFTIAEDLALVGIARRAGYGARVHASPETTVALTPVPTLTHHVSQLRRWLAGGFEAPWYYRAGIVFMFAYHFVLSLFLIAGWFVSVPATLAVWVLKFVGDAAIVGVEARRTRQPSLMLLLPIIELYTTAALLWLPLSFLVRPTVQWRGSGFVVAYDPESRTTPAETRP